MTEETSRPSVIFAFYDDILAAQQKFLPSADMASRLTKFSRTVFDAQIAYAQALVGANAQMLGAWTAKPQKSDTERPSVAAKRNEVLTA